jgi:hypothetical protein
VYQLCEAETVDPNITGAIVDGAIPLLGGAYCTLLAFRVVGKKPGQDARYDDWHRRWGSKFRVLGPLLAVAGRKLLQSFRQTGSPIW